MAVDSALPEAPKRRPSGRDLSFHVSVTQSRAVNVCRPGVPTCYMSNIEQAEHATRGEEHRTREVCRKANSNTTFDSNTRIGWSKRDARSFGLK
jgi:hypothetical protein